MRVELPKLDFFKDLLERAKAYQSGRIQKYKKWIDQYNGDLSIDGGKEDAITGYNITYELIESTKDSTIPQPAVTPIVKSQKTNRNARSIEQLCKDILDELDFEKKNDLDELMTYVYGSDNFVVEWDDSVDSDNGHIVVRAISPKNYFPQPDIVNIDEMEYCFIQYTTARDDLIRTFDITPAQAEEADMGDAVVSNDEVVTVYVCFYRGEDGEVCKFTWSGDTVLQDITDYYARKVRKCRKCGKLEYRCRCDEPDIFIDNIEFEELDDDIVTSDGTVIPKEIPKIKNGEMVMEKTNAPIQIDGNIQMDELGLPILQEVEVPKMVANKIKWYKPKAFPVITRINVSAPDSIYGQSDCEFMRPLQQELNKVLSRLHEKIMGSECVPVVPPDVQTNDENILGEVEEVSNGIFRRYLKLAPGQTKDQYGVINTEVSIQQDLQYAEYIYDKAKRLMGITESYQGNPDRSADSGFAKQLQIQQSAGRLQMKRINKQYFYSQMFKVIFELNLAYSDEPFPVSFVDEMGEIQNLQFNRYDFLVQDDVTGEFYYDDRYLFSCDKYAEIEEDKNQMWQLTMQMYTSGMYGAINDPVTMVRVWMQLEKYGMPFARENVNYFKSMIERMNSANGGQ